MQRLRAVLSDDHLLLVLAERADPGTVLFGVSVSLTAEGRPAGDRLLLGMGLFPSDHELVPVSGGGAILVHTQSGNTGPLVALQRLYF